MDSHQQAHTQSQTIHVNIKTQYNILKSLVRSQIACYLLTLATSAHCCTASLTTLVYLGHDFLFFAHATSILPSPRRLKNALG